MKREQEDAAVPAPKMKFVPKIPPRKQLKTAATKVEPNETKDDLISKELLAKVNSAKAENSFARKSRGERKAAPVQVAFGHGSLPYIRSFGNPKSADGSVVFADSIPIVKEYVEPFDYVHTNYPVTLPLRRPYSGDPEQLDKEEFGEDSVSRANLPEGSPAEELGMKEASTEPQMFLFQFPEALPLAKEPTAAANGEENNVRPDTENVGNRGNGNRLDAAAAENEKSGGKPADAGNKPRKGCTLKDLPSGFIGKLLVYKSGKVKMKIGDALFDVSPGESGIFAQDAAVINVKEKHCCILGDLPKKAVVTPDIDSLLESIEKM